MTRRTTTPASAPLPGTQPETPLHAALRANSHTIIAIFLATIRQEPLNDLRELLTTNHSEFPALAAAQAPSHTTPSH